MLSPSILSRLREPRALPATIGTLGLFLFAFGTLDGAGAANIGLGLMLVGLIARSLVEPHGFRADPLLVLVALYLLYLAARTALAWDAAPDPGALRWGANRWGLAVFVPLGLVAAWAAPDRQALPLLGVSLAGLLYRVAVHVEPEKLAGIAEGWGRATFGSSATKMGLWAAVVLLGVLCFAPRVLALPPRRPSTWALAALGTAVAVLAAAGLVYAKARMAWVAAAVVIPTTVAWLALRDRRPATLGTLGAVSLLGLAVVGLSWDVVAERLAAEGSTLYGLLSGSLAELPPDSVGLHAAMYQRFGEVWLQHPLLGWGPGASRWLIASSPLTMLHDKGFVHFHNTPLTILAELGLFGLALFVALAVLVASSMLRASRAGLVPRDVLAFLVGTLLLIALAGMTDDVVFTRHGSYFTGLVAGLAYAAGRTGIPGARGRIAHPRVRGPADQRR